MLKSIVFRGLLTGSRCSSVLNTTTTTGSPLDDNQSNQNGSSNLYFSMTLRNFATTMGGSGGSKSAASTAVPEPPKRVPTSFSIFIQERYGQLPSSSSDRATDKLKQLASEWKSMSEGQRDPYRQLYLERKAVYTREMTAFLGSLQPEQLTALKESKKEKIRIRHQRELRLKLRELNYPKRPISAYSLFVQSRYSSAEGGKAADQMRLLASEWKSMSESGRATFQEKAKHDMVRYESELTAWNQRMAKQENDHLRAEVEKLRKGSSRRQAVAVVPKKKKLVKKVVKKAKAKKSSASSAKGSKKLKGTSAAAKKASSGSSGQKVKRGATSAASPKKSTK